MSIALAYHTATKYSPDTIHQHPGLDWGQQPIPYKQYHAAAPVELASFLPLDPNPFTGTSGVSPEALPVAGELDRRAISQWLYFTYGVTAIIERQPRALYLRAAPSAGGLYPAECYLVVRREIDGIAPGLYGYDPLHHRLASLWPGPDVAQVLDGACYGNAAVCAAPIVLVVTAVFQRSAWRYRERAYRRVLLDSGHLIGNAGLAASALGLRTHVTSAFADASLNTLLRLDDDEEGALALVALNTPGTVERPVWSVVPGTTSVDPELPLLQRLHRASAAGVERPKLVQRGESQAEALERRYAAVGGVPLTYDAGDCALSEAIQDTILHRRSTRRFVRESITQDQLARILAAAYEPEAIGLPPQPMLDRGELMTFIAIADVEGIEPGVYYFAPHSRTLRLLRTGLDRDDVQYLCLGQELGGDAAATIFHTAELPRCIARLGDRAYRSLHLDAGILGERLNLAALADGLGASGIGGFFDDRVNALLGIPAEQAVIYITTIGTPADE